MELETIIEGLKTDYAELRRTVETKAQEAAKGAVDPLIEAKLGRINDEINRKEAARDQIVAEMQTRMKAIESRNQDDPKVSAEFERRLGQFNRELRSNSHAGGRTSLVDVSADEFRAYDAAFGSFIRKGVQRLTPDEARAMSVGSDPDGGYTVTPDMSGRIVQRIFELSPIRQFAFVETIGTDSLEGENETDDASGGWVSEQGTRSDSSNPTIGKYRIPVHEMYSQPKSSQKLLEDSNRDVPGWLQKRTSNKFARIEASAFTVGDGVGKPRGFASYATNTTGDTSRAWGVFEHVASGTSGTLGTDPNGVQKLLALIHKLNPEYIPGARWFMNRNTLATVRGLTDASSAGKFVFVPSFTAGIPDTLMGYPVTPVVDMVDLAANSLSIAFGDMNAAYTIVDRAGMTLLIDPYTDKPNVRFYMRRRVGGDVVNFDALKFIKAA